VSKVAAAAAPRTAVEARFARVLSVPPCARSDHFMMHHLDQAQLSTGLDQDKPLVVDELPAPLWLGLVVPKRHARRAVTRNLMRRQMRACMALHGAGLPVGDWVLRLRKPYDRKQFPSARSEALAASVRQELQQLFERVGRQARRVASASAP
jgi:ribonuclease P protein component